MGPGDLLAGAAPGRGRASLQQPPEPSAQRTALRDRAEHQGDIRGSATQPSLFSRRRLPARSAAPGPSAQRAKWPGRSRRSAAVLWYPHSSWVHSAGQGAGARRQAPGKSSSSPSAHSSSIVSCSFPQSEAAACSLQPGPACAAPRFPCNPVGGAPRGLEGQGSWRVRAPGASAQRPARPGGGGGERPVTFSEVPARTSSLRARFWGTSLLGPPSPPPKNAPRSPTPFLPRTRIRRQ